MTLTAQSLFLPSLEHVVPPCYIFHVEFEGIKLVYGNVPSMLVATSGTSLCVE